MNTQKTISCLIGGALGDALGRPVERICTPQLYDYYGPDGIQDLQTVGMKARITDDTQMTLAFDLDYKLNRGNTYRILYNHGREARITEEEFYNEICDFSEESYDKRRRLD